MTAPGPAEWGGDAQAQVKATVDNARALGLIWTLRLATMTSIDPVEGIYDGDTEAGGVAIAMTSMVGSVAIDDRVYVIGVPPSGNFIVGRVGLPFASRQVLSQAAGSVTFDPIPSTLRTLKISYNSRGDSVKIGRAHV